ncbi:MAG: TetR/AcrR family transcriptional regulator [Clostridia bacterium]|nr:TetR/AcrR family transcriptional regulator [Clostridia bacterium]
MDKIIKNKNEKYQKLISAAYELFESKEAAKVSIDEIVKKAGVAKGTFYLYFKDKYDLISKIILKKAAEFLKNEDDSISEADMNSGKFAYEVITLLADFLEKNKTLTMLIDKNVHVCVNAVIENRDGKIKQMYDKMLEYFENLGFSEDDVKIKLYIYIDMIVSSCCNAILRGYPYTLDEIKSNLYEIVTMSIHNITEEDAKI